jgi:quinolinate synthase
MEDHCRVQDAETVEQALELLRAKLGGVVLDFELVQKAELAFAINQLKREMNAVILGHNYMESALYHSIPDYTGDSLELSRISARTEADVIIFCGVQFMAETAKVLSPGKRVLIPAEKAGCSLAEGITAEDVLKLREKYPDAPVVTYVNTYASVKAESDYCCTSGNSSAVVRHLLQKGHKTILFLPDEYLARNTATEMGVRYVSATDDPVQTDEPVIVGWNVRCEVHELYKPEDVDNARKQYPGVVIMAHPECSPDVIAKVDYAGSTKGMLEYVRNHPTGRYLLLTECSMADNIAADNPNLDIVRACSLRCKHMNLITLEDTLAAMKNMQYEIHLPSDLMERARLPIQRMLEIN